MFLSIPGFWLLHCHIDFHLDLGMGLIVQVGELSEMKPKPKNFPTCGNWEFEVNLETFFAKVAICKAQYPILAFTHKYIPFQDLSYTYLKGVHYEPLNSS